MSTPWDYLFVRLNGAGQAHRRLAEGLAAARAAAGGDVVAQFQPQLGWWANEAAVLAHGGDLAPVEAAIAKEGLVVERHRLTPTARPRAEDRLIGGGVYVHRWFTVGAADVDEFVALSAEAWPSFETQFDAKIFGLFRAEPDAADAAAGQVRLLLLTRYGDHGVWEASRDPTTDAMQIFFRRQQLTRQTRACSTLLVGG
ncbi:MAG TPA: hypothetical protein VG939_21690 [Caulobacteraceae bacterium]|nr:hypothetical protein [Caulobacteraceae bacterium]